MANIESVMHEIAGVPAAGRIHRAGERQARRFRADERRRRRRLSRILGRARARAPAVEDAFTRRRSTSPSAPFYKWFEDGDAQRVVQLPRAEPRRTATPDKVAIVFEADDGKVTRVTYQELYHRVCRFANGLKSLGIAKGDRVIVYMPMSIEGVVAMQACARIGATHSVVFGGFSAKSLQERIIDAGAVAVITADEQARGGKHLPLKAIVDEALGLGGCESIRNVVVYRRTGGEGRVGRRSATSGCTSSRRRRPTPASPNGSAPSIRCSSSTRRAPPASRRASSTARAATCCGRS